MIPLIFIVSIYNDAIDPIYNSVIDSVYNGTNDGIYNGINDWICNETDMNLIITNAHAVIGFIQI